MKVLVFGTFDHLHPGHQFVLDTASARGDLFVVVARDKTVERIKGKTPRQPEAERQAAIQSVYPHAHVILGDSADYLVPVREIQPDIILFGYDQQLPPGVTEEALGAKIERLPAFEPHKYKSSLQGK